MMEDEKFREEIKKFIYFLSNENISFVYYGKFGGHFGLDEEEIFNLYINHGKFWSDYFGCTENEMTEYLKWVSLYDENGHYLQCNFIIPRTGKRCRNNSQQPQYSDVKNSLIKIKEGRIGKCILHDGESPEKRL